ncbi:MAG: NAD-dependent epimerase/dehydratase family protein [Anaerolineales bacterium]|nr:NAD-dependent epimerase/dehydratase family protein [Anaerolineales bacterium]
MTYLSDYAGRSILVTGGMGFIGSNLARRLVDLDAHVTLVDSLIPDYGGNWHNLAGYQDRLRVNIADVRDPYSMHALVQGQDILFNLAGQVSHMDSMTDPYTDLEINTRSQLSILEACRYENPQIKVIYAGTRQQYGKPRYLPLDEDHLQAPTDVNGVNKLAGEWYHIVYNNAYGLRTTSLRLTNTYGPRQLVKHDRQGFIGWFIRKAVRNEEIQIYGDGTQLRDLTYVDDVVDAFLRAGAREQANGRVYNLGGQHPINLLELANLIVATAGRGRVRLIPWPDQRKKIDIGDVYSSYQRIQDELGWQPVIPLAEGLHRTINFYLQNGEHYW